MSDSAITANIFSGQPLYHATKSVHSHVMNMIPMVVDPGYGIPVGNYPCMHVYMYLIRLMMASAIFCYDHHHISLCVKRCNM